MDMVKSPEMVSRLDLVVLELAVAGIVFRRLPQGPLWRGLVGVASLGLHLRCFF